MIPYVGRGICALSTSDYSLQCATNILCRGVPYFTQKTQPRPSSTILTNLWSIILHITVPFPSSSPVPKILE